MLPGMSKRSASRKTRPSRVRKGPAVVRAMGSADLLRFVPDLVAVDPQDSLVVVLFRHSQGTRSRTRGAMRIDLLHSEDPVETERWAEALLGQVLRVEGITGVAVVAYTDESFAPSGRPPAAAQIRAVARQAERVGLEVLDRFCVAADGWGSLGDPLLPRGGRPLEEIEPAERRRALPRRAEEVVLAPLEKQQAFQLDYADWWTRADGPGGVLHGASLAEPGSSFGIAAETEPAMERYRWGRDIDEVVAIVEGMLEPHDEADGPCPCRALLLALAERQGVMNLVLAQIAWGPAFGTELWTAANAPKGRERSLDRMVAAIGGGRFTRPDADRIERAVAVLLETAGYIPLPADRAPIDDMLSWLHWAHGGSSAAADHATRALRADPGRDVAAVVLAKIRRGDLPEWAFRPDPRKPDPFESLLRTERTAAR